MSTSASSTRTPTLCCECGNVRTVSTNAYPRTTDPYSPGEGHNAAYLAGLHERGHDLGMQPFWRCLRTLACSACKRPTRHAEIRQDEHRDWAENQDRSRDLDRRELNARLHRLELAGIDVRWRDEDKDWPKRAIINLFEFRDESPRWLVEVRESADPDQLLRQMVDVERTIDREELAYEWQEDSDGEQWRGKRFLTG
jgi:hypothetical protein